MHVIGGYVEVNDDVESDTMRHLEVWTERQWNERNRVNELLLVEGQINVSSHKRTIISESESLQCLYYLYYCYFCFGNC